MTMPRSKPACGACCAFCEARKTWRASAKSGRKYPVSPLQAWRRFAAIVSGLAFLAAGLWLAAALATHDRGDPSWNQSISAFVKNEMGLPGAEVSDALLQSFGLAAWLLPIVLVDWALRLVTGRGLKRLWLKMMVLPFLLIAAAFAVSIVPPFASWPLKVGLGGVIGKLGRDGIAHINVAPPLSAMAAAILVALMLLYVLGWSFIGFAPRGEEKRRYVRPSAARQQKDPAPGLWARVFAWRLSLPSLSLWREERGRHASAQEDLRLRREPRLGPPSSAAEDEDEDAEEIDVSVKRVAKVDMPRRARNARKAAPGAARSRPGAASICCRRSICSTKCRRRALPQINEDALQQNARLLESVLEDFGVRGQIVKVRPGPGGHALRAGARARHQGVARHRPGRRHRPLDERDLGARRRRARPQRHRHRAAQLQRARRSICASSWPRRPTSARRPSWRSCSARISAARRSSSISRACRIC